MPLQLDAVGGQAGGRAGGQAGMQLVFLRSLGATLRIAEFLADLSGGLRAEPRGLRVQGRGHAAGDFGAGALASWAEETKMPPPSQMVGGHNSLPK